MKKKGGFIVTAELVLIATVLVIGMLVGLVVVRDAIVAEMEDIAESIGDMNQSFQFDGIDAIGNESDPATSGAQWTDVEDIPAGDTLGMLGNGASIVYLPPPEGELPIIIQPAGP